MGSNMKRTIRVVLNGQKVEAKIGAAITDLLERHPHPGRHPALGAVVDHQLTGLGRRLRGDCAVDTVDLTSKAGADIYRRTAVLMLTVAAEHLYPESQLVVGQSIAHGYFFSLSGQKITRRLVGQLQEEMERLRDEDISLQFRFTTIDEAIRHYQARGLSSKVDLLRQTHETEILVTQLGERLSLPYGPLAMHTGVIHHFSLLPYEDGMVLRFPDRRGQPIRHLTPQPKLFATFREAQRWNELIGVANLSQLNRRLISGEAGDLIRISEGLHEKKIVEVADMIAARRDKLRLILVAGPSASGKTTTSKRLGVQLCVNGIEPVTINLDDYYCDPEDTPCHADGRLNFEHLEALDLELLDDHLRRIIAGERVETPQFNFQTHRRHETKTRPIQLQPNQMLVLEGIHALNPRLTPRVPIQAKFRLFVSALTQLTIDEHNRLFTADARLLRRLVRDRVYRSHGAEQTIQMWDSVRSGESKWIFPFQEDADVLFNSALVYEQAVLTTFAKRFLMEVPRESPAFVEADRLLRVIDLFIPILPEEVPATSVLREFIGGSAFRY